AGQWTLEPPAIDATPAVPGTPAATATPGGMGSGWGSSLPITPDATRLTVEYAGFRRYDLQPPPTITDPRDGSEGRSTVMMGRGEQLETSHAQWNDRTLVIVTTAHVSDRSAGGAFTTELIRKLSLETPTTLIVEATRAGVLGGKASTTRAKY